jgi:Tfp pilus assembly protein PilN
MKDIDFIPAWYKEKQRRNVMYRRQYMGVVGMFALLVIVSFIAGRSLSDSRAEIETMKNTIYTARTVMAQHEHVRSQLQAIEESQSRLYRLRSKADYGAIISELSYEIPQQIVLKALTIETEPYRPENMSAVQGDMMKIAGQPVADTKSVLPSLNLRHKIVIEGLASGASDVALLISALEKSNYFCHVLPGFSRSVTLDQKNRVDFQVVCYLANYVEP